MALSIQQLVSIGWLTALSAIVADRGTRTDARPTTSEHHAAQLQAEPPLQVGPHVHALPHAQLALESSFGVRHPQVHSAPGHVVHVQTDESRETAFEVLSMVNSSVVVRLVR